MEGELKILFIITFKSKLARVVERVYTLWDFCFYNKIII